MVSEYRFKVAIRSKGSLEFMNLHGRYRTGSRSVKIYDVRSTMKQTTVNNMYYFFFSLFLIQTSYCKF